MTADGLSTPVELPDVIDVAVLDSILCALSLDALTTRSPDDGSVTSTVASFGDGANAAAFTFDDGDAVVAIDSAGVDGLADRLLRIPLDGGPTTTITLERPVSRPTLTDTVNGFVVRGTFDETTTWFGSDGAALADGTDPLWPAGDGYLTGTFFPEVIEAHVGDETSTVLEVASQPRSVLAFTDGPVVAPDAPGARAIPLVETPGSIEGVPSTLPEQTTTSAASTTLAPTTSAPATTATSTAPQTTTAASLATTNDDNGGGSGWLVGIVIAVIAVGWRWPCGRCAGSDAGRPRLRCNCCRPASRAIGVISFGEFLRTTPRITPIDAVRHAHAGSPAGASDRKCRRAGELGQST